MFELMIKKHFDASHTLPFHEGKCKRPHGHTYHVEISFAIENLDSNGMGVDFYILKKAFKRVEDLLDHRDLNEIFDVFNLTTTAENICLFIYAALVALSDENLDYNFRVNKVTVWETPSGGCSYIYNDNDMVAIVKIKLILISTGFDNIKTLIDDVYFNLIHLQKNVLENIIVESESYTNNY